MRLFAVQTVFLERGFLTSLFLLTPLIKKMGGAMDRAMGRAVDMKFQNEKYTMDGVLDGVFYAKIID